MSTGDQIYFYFFSYGSNLLLEHIKLRTPSVEVIRNHQLDVFELIFNKRSTDGSTKANIHKTGDFRDFVLGVIQRIALEEKPKLDSAEGLGAGYVLESFPLEIDGNERKIHYYIAIEEKYFILGKPYDWYLEYVIYGAIENGFPEDYIEGLKSIAFDIDKDKERREEHDIVLKK